MWIELPDEHPGRCRNHRSVAGADGHETVRCLDYEGTEHTCTFPPPKRQVTLGLSYTTRIPKPWVKPEDRS